MAAGRGVMFAALVAHLAIAAGARGDVVRQQLTASLTQPQYVAAPPGDLNRLFIAERNGLVRILDISINSVMPTPFLDVSARIFSVGEGGLLAMAFRPGDLSHLLYIGIGDGMLDGIEVALGTDPNNPLDFPALPLSRAWVWFFAAIVLCSAAAGKLSTQGLREHTEF